MLKAKEEIERRFLQDVPQSEPNDFRFAVILAPSLIDGAAPS
jgi:hypothetical protein